MTLDPAILQRLAIRVDVTAYVRIIARVHAATPLGMGPGRSRFSSPRDRFRLLYMAQDPITAFAEAIVRDRFEKNAIRSLHEEDIDRYSIAQVRNPRPLLLLDLRYEGEPICSACPPTLCVPRRRPQGVASVNKSMISPISMVSSTCPGSPIANASPSMIVRLR